MPAGLRARTIVDPGLFFTLPIGTRLAISVEGAFAAMLKTGDISEGDNYGQGTVTGFDGEVHVDYRFARHIFARQHGLGDVVEHPVEL